MYIYKHNVQAFLSMNTYHFVGISGSSTLQAHLYSNHITSCKLPLS